MRFCELSVYTITADVHYWNGNMKKSIGFCLENTFSFNFWNEAWEIRSTYFFQKLDVSVLAYEPKEK